MKEDLKKKIACCVSVVFLLILFLAGTMKFISIQDANITLYLYKVKGFSIVFVAALVYLYSIFTDKKGLMYLSFIVAICGYVYTFSSLNDVSSSDIGNGLALGSFIKYEIGYYVYIFSLVFLVVNCIISFLFNLDDKVDSDNINQVNLNLVKEKEKYIISNYIYGLKDREGLSDKLVVIALKDNSKDLEILISSNEVIKLEICYDFLKSINIRKVILMNNTNKEIKNDELSNKVLATALVGVWGPVVGGSKLVNTISDLNNYNKVGFKELYEIKIEYILNGEVNVLMVKTKSDPRSFFEIFEDKLIKNV